MTKMFDDVEVKMKMYVQQHDTKIAADKKDDVQLYERVHFDAVFKTWFYLKRQQKRKKESTQCAVRDRRYRAKSAIDNTRKGRFNSFTKPAVMKKFNEDEKKAIVHARHCLLDYITRYIRVMYVAAFFVRCRG